MTARRPAWQCFLMMAALGACLWLAHSRAEAQDAAPPPGKEAAPASADPKGRRTPREALKTFIENTHAAVKRGETARMQEAVACLDLALIPEAARVDKGPVLAKTLYDVLARLWEIDWETVPDEPAGPTFRRALTRDGEEYAVLEIVHQPGQGWRLAPEFVNALPELRARVQGLPYIGGLGGARDWAYWIEDRVPESLKTVTFALAYWQWLAILTLVLLGVVLGKLATFASHAVLAPLVNRSRIKAVDEAIQGAERPFGFCVTALLWLVGLWFLNLPAQIHGWLSFAVKVLAVFAVSMAAYRAVDVLTAYLAYLASLTRNVMDDLLVPLVRKTLKIFVAVVGVVLVAEQLGFDVTKMLVGLGIGGLALALASKDTLENLFGSFTVILDRPFKIGDWVKLGDVEGAVEEVGFRSTRIRTFADALVSVPNSKLVNAPIENFGLRRRRRLRTMLAVTYGTPAVAIEAFCEGVRELIRRHPCTWKENYLVYLNAWGPSSLDIMLSCYLDVPDYASELREKARLYLDVLRLAKRLGVDFAFPTQTLYMARAEAAPAGPAGTPVAPDGRAETPVAPDDRAGTPVAPDGPAGTPVAPCAAAVGDEDMQAALARARGEAAALAAAHAPPEQAPTQTPGAPRGTGELTHG